MTLFCDLIAQQFWEMKYRLKDINGEAINMSNENVASTVKAMTKDYSALMKAIDKKKIK